MVIKEAECGRACSPVDDSISICQESSPTSTSAAYSGPETLEYFTPERVILG